MRWTYSIKNKLAAAGVLFGLCILVLLSNYNDRIHTKQIKEMISTLYQDRLIAEEYLFKLTNNLYKIREIVISENKNSVRDDNSDEIWINISATIDAYKKTELTQNEEIIFGRFEKSVKQLQSAFDDNKAAKLIHSKASLSILEELSNLQLEESKLIVNNSEEKYKLSKLLSNFAFAIAIILLLFLQALVFSSRTLHISNRNINTNLN